jgi:hypothetical protein
MKINLEGFDENADLDSFALIKAPLTENDVVSSKEDLKDDNIYLIIYTNCVDFTKNIGDGLEKERNEIELMRKGSQEPQDTLPICKTFTKVFRGSAT